MMKNRKQGIAFLLIAGVAAFWVFRSFEAKGQSPTVSGGPVFSAAGELSRPVDYREWVWLSTGLGMSYSANTSAGSNPNPAFDNVFVTPASYRSFLQTGKWPDKTMFVLEVRPSVTQGSINKGGFFQGQRSGMEVEVKDEKRFPGSGGWAFFDFGSAPSAKPIPTSVGCYSCHAQNGAVDNTFVQFYPTLIDIARQKGTFKDTPEKP